MVSLCTLAFWVQIYDVPIGYFSEKVGIMLGNFIGRFLEYDASNRGASWKPYMQIRVEVDVNKPLKRRKSIKMKECSSATVSFKYEHLRSFCFICGRLDHTESRCERLYDNGSGAIEKGWGPELKALDRSGKPLPGERWLKQEKESGEWSVSHDRPSTQNQTVGEDSGRTGTRVILNKGKGIALEHSDTRMNVNTNTLIINPMYAASEEDLEEDRVGDLQLEIKKRKRIGTEAGETNTITSITTLSDSFEEEFGSDVNHFLAVAPGGGDHRGQ